MNDIKRAAAKRLDKKLRLSGYFLEPGQDSVPMSEIWLYSCNVKDKKIRQRASFQLTYDAYRDILHGSNEVIYHPLDDDEYDLLSSLYYRYDNESDSLDQAEKQITSLLMLRLALSDSIFKSEDPIKPGTHFIILDIVNDGGLGLCRFSVVDHPGILTNDEVLEATEIFLDRANLL
ncbi:hypothetical protein [Ectopseudomonas oleovorans]|uniref:hypothetical protein n=1 Tax=Ectopseudomonas oleovorans TaxID=301 RepID=UPI0035B4B542